tara:strand:+ start:1299 stop:1883 length:585 start_codon:yes stop_codon:yes gene_type:complete
MNEVMSISNNNILNKDTLIQMIKDELSNIIGNDDDYLIAGPSEEIDEVALCHNKKGHFDHCDKGSVYSLTYKGASKNNIDKSFVKRGNVTSKKSGDPPKVSAKYGVNTSTKKSAGRKTIEGDDISPKYYVSKYPEKYSEGIVKGSEEDRKKKMKIKMCREIGFRSAQEVIHRFLIQQDRLARSTKGDLFKTKKK